MFRHPAYPKLEMTSTSLAVQAVPGTRMVVYTPVNGATRAAMERLVAADPSAHYFPCWPAHVARARDLVPLRLIPPGSGTRSNGLRTPQGITVRAGTNHPKLAQNTLRYRLAVRPRRDDRRYTINEPANAGCDPNTVPKHRMSLASSVTVSCPAQHAKREHGW